MPKWYGLQGLIIIMPVVTSAVFPGCRYLLSQHLEAERGLLQELAVAACCTPSTCASQITCGAVCCQHGVCRRYLLSQHPEAERGLLQELAVAACCTPKHVHSR
jgi:hypothetical protein